MAGEEFDSDVLRFEDAKKREGDFLISNRGQLNRSFIEKLNRNKRNRGGGGCTRSSQHPIEGPATLFLTGYVGDSAEDSTVYTSEASLSEGDSATVKTGGNEFRVKFFGLSIERPETDRIRKKQSAYVSIDVWNEEDKVWREVEAMQGFSDPLEWEYPGGDTIRIAVDTAPGRDAEADLTWLIKEGLSPAEALDYWMVEIMNKTQTQWADERGRSRQAISKNINDAKSVL